MNNTDKLLRAFIKASGYEIEEVKVATEVRVADNWDSVMHISNTEYKVTAKDSYVPIPIQSDEWGCIVDFVSNHADDIENNINDYGVLAPIWGFMRGTTPIKHSSNASKPKA